MIPVERLIRVQVWIEIVTTDPEEATAKRIAHQYVNDQLEPIYQRDERAGVAPPFVNDFEVEGTEVVSS